MQKKLMTLNAIVTYNGIGVERPFTEATSNQIATVSCKQRTQLRGCQMIDKVGQLLRAWFSCPRKSTDKITEP